MCDLILYTKVGFEPGWANVSHLIMHHHFFLMSVADIANRSQHYWKNTPLLEFALKIKLFYIFKLVLISCGGNSGHATALVYWLIGSEVTWKTANAERGFLWTSFICLKTDAPKTTLRLYKSPPWEFHQLGKLSHHRRED